MSETPEAGTDSAALFDEIGNLKKHITNMNEFMRGFMAGAERRAERLERKIVVYELALNKIISMQHTNATEEAFELCAHTARAGLAMGQAEEERK